MKPLVLTSRAVNIRVHQYRLQIDDYFNRVHQEFPAHELPFDFLVINNATGNVSLSALKFLMNHGVQVVLMDWDGKPTGMLSPPGPISGALQIAQLRAYIDPERRKRVAQAFLDEKYGKTVQLLTHLRRYYPAIEMRGVAREIQAVTKARGSDIRRTLMVKEARVAAEYFREFGKVVNQLAPELGFKSRGQSSPSNNMSASDPMNVALNVAYGILECWVRAAVGQSGLNENVGFLHEAQPGALPLVYDFMEPFRWIADYSLIQLLERKEIGRSDFTVTPELRLRMKPESIRLLVERLAENFGRKTPGNDRQRKYDTVLVDGTRKLARHLTGDANSLDFRAPFVADQAEVDAQLRKRVLGMSTEERKKLGIQNPTYHYIRKRALVRKPLRLYGKVLARLSGQGVSAD